MLYDSAFSLFLSLSIAVDKNGHLNTDEQYCDNIQILDIKALKNAMRPRISTRVPYIKNSRRLMTFILANSVITTKTPTWVKQARTQFHNYDVTKRLFRPVRKSRNVVIDLVVDERNKMDKVAMNEQLPRLHRDVDFNEFQLEQDEVLQFCAPATTSRLRSRCELQEYKYRHSTHLKVLKMYKNFCAEQQDFVKAMRNTIMDMSNSDEPSVEFTLLTGHAGCGKTSTLELITLLGYVKTHYVAITHRLCAAARNNYRVRTSTFCKFLMDLTLVKSSEVMDFGEILTYIHENYFTADTFTNDIGDFFYDQYHRISRSDEDTPDDEEMIWSSREYELRVARLNTYVDLNRTSPFSKGLQKITARDYTGHISRFVNVIYLDEISMFTTAKIELFMSVFEALSKIMREKFLVVLVGDFAQILPLFSATTSYDSVIEKCTQKFNFVQQHRITDLPYLDVVMQLTNDHLMTSFNFLNRLKQVIPADRYCDEIPYCYPRKNCELMYNKYRQLANPYEWLDQLPEKFFERVLPFTIFCFTNQEMHYNNLSMAFKITSQFDIACILERDRRKFVEFATFELAYYRMCKPISPHGNGLIPILPLIRYFPYKVLVSSSTLVVSKTIVYLLDWDLSDPLAANVTVYNPNDGKVFIIRMGNFSCNMCSLKLNGIPLELFVSSTIHSSQGLTLDNDVVLSLHNIDRHELFVILTRVRSSDQIFRFYDK